MPKKKTPPEWNLQTRYFALAILIILGGFFLWYIRPLITPIVVSILLAYVLHPLVSLLENKTRLPYKYSVAVVFILFVAVLIYIPASVTPVVIEEINSLDIDFVEVVRVLENLSEEIAKVDIPFINLEETVATIQTELFEFLRPENVFRTIESVTENVVWMLVILIITYYLLADWEKLRTWGYRQFPTDYQPDAIRIYRSISKVWRLYLRGQVFSMLILGFVSGIGAVAVGLQGPLAIGLVSGVLAILPSVGSSLMVLVTGVEALFSQSTVLNVSDWWFVTIVVLVFAGIHVFDNYWLRPKILGGGLELHEAVVLVGVIGGITLGGVVLGLIIVPLVSSVAIIVQYTLRRIMGADPWEGIDPIV